MADQYVLSLLKAWGRFRREGWNPKLGFDTVNILLKTPTGGQPEHIPDDILEVDKAVSLLPKHQRRTIVLTYEARQSLRKGANEMNVSKEIFRRYLGEAENRVAGYMMAVNTRGL